MKLSSAEDGKKTGDGTGVGFFIPLSEALASQFPSLGDNDSSPPHCTFLYIGHINKDQEAKFLEISNQVFTDMGRSVRGTLDYFEYFLNAENESRVAVMRIRFNQHLDEVRWKLRDALMDAGIQVDDSFPLIYQPHATLEYIDSPDTPYKGPTPQGSWDFSNIEIWGLPKLHVIPFTQDSGGRLASRYVDAANHKTSIELMKFLSNAVNKLGIGRHVYVVGGAVRNFIINEPIKDIDVVVDSIGARKDSDWLAKKLQRVIPARTSLVTNQYGVAILTVKEDWFVGDSNLKGEAIEIANARKESYGESAGKGYKPHMVEPSTIQEDVIRREFTFNTLLWRMSELASGPEKAEILDLTGCGRKDLDEGMMRCPSNPNKTFTDDPSRMIRAIKFLIKYGFKIAPDVKSSIKRNAQKLKNIPPGHLSNMIINLFFEPGHGSKALLEMNKLGLLDVVREITVKDKAFREALANWADRSGKIDFLFELMGYNMPTGRRLKFLSKPQLVRLRDITAPMDSDEAEKLVVALGQPGKVVNMKQLISEFGLKGQEIRQLTEVLRQVILKDPRMVLTPARLEKATRKQMGKKAKVYTEKDFEPALRRYQESLYALLTAYDQYNTDHNIKDQNPRSRAYALKYRLNNAWVKVIMSGRELASIALDQKSIPKGQAKKMEMSARLFMAARAFPRNFDTWLNRNMKHINYLKTTTKWDDKTEGGDELFKLGPFEVHNTIQASDKELEAIKMMFSKAISLVKKAGGPASGLKKTLYGDIYVVGRLGQANTSAWYDTSKDFIYTRNLKRAGLRDVRTVIHELSHRYYKNNLSNIIKTRWRKHHIQVSHKSVKVEIPKKGERLPFSVNGVENPKVLGENVLDGTIMLDASKKYPGTAVVVGRSQVYKWMRGVAEKLAFPTRYSATNQEEHFCDAMALYVMGDLDKDHTKALKEVFSGKDDSDRNFVVKVQEDVARASGRTAIGRVAKGFMKKQASYFKAGDPIFFGKYKNKKGIIKGFGKNIKNQSVTVIIEPDPKGRKQEKAISLYNIWHRDIEKRGAIDRIALGHEAVTPKNTIKELRGWKKEINVGNAKWIIYTNPNKKERIIDRGNGLGRWLWEEWWTEDKHKAPYWMEAELAPTFKKLWADMRRGPKPKVPAPNPIKTPPELRKWKRSLEKERTFHRTVFTSPDGQTKIREGKPNSYGTNNQEWTSFVKSRGSWHLDQMERELSKLVSVMKKIDRLAAKFQKKKEVPKADGKGTTTVYEYSEGQIQTRNRDKAKRVEALRGKLDKLQTAIKKDLKSKDPQTKMTALAIGLINDTFERVGNSGSAKDGHFGVTGWQAKHVTLGSGKATFKYVAKSGVSQTKTTTDAGLISALRDAMKGKTGANPIFKSDDFTVDSGKVNAYLKSFDITAKDIRGLHANRQVQKALKSIRSSGGKLPTDPKEKEKKLKAEFQSAIEQAAKAVGHEATTLKNQYLVPGLEDNYLKDGTVKENLARQKKASVNATKDHGEREDEETAKLVKPLPKKNPPRHDLRNERVNVDKEKDTGGNKADNDKDMSLNYKRVAVDSLVDRWLRQAVEKRNPGDIWQTPKGWSVKLEEGNIQQARSKNKAKKILDNFRKGKNPEGVPSGGNKPQEEEGLVEDTPTEEPTEDKGFQWEGVDWKGFKKVDKKSPVFKELAEEHGADLVELSLIMKANAEGAKVKVPHKLYKTDAYKDLNGLDASNGLLMKGLLKSTPDDDWTPIIKSWEESEKSKAEEEAAAEKSKAEEEAAAKDEEEAQAQPEETPENEAQPDEAQPEKTQPDEAKPEKPKPDKDTENYQKFVDSVKKDKLFKGVVEDIADLEPVDQIKVMKAYNGKVSAITKELKAGKFSTETMQAASDALEDPSGGVTASSELMGESMALAMIAKNVVANPLVMGGERTNPNLSTDPKMDKAPVARKTASFYSSLTPALRQEAVKQTKKLFQSLDEGSPERVELDSIADGIHHASIIQGDFDDPRSGNATLRPPPGPGLQKTLQVLHKDGDDIEVLDAIVEGGLDDSKVSELFRNTLENMSDDDLYEAAGGVDGPDSLTIELLQSGDLPAKDREFVQKMLIDGVVSSIVSYDAITTLLTLRARSVKKKLKKDDKNQKPSDSDNQDQGDSELLGGHDDTDLDWTSPPEGGGLSLQETMDEIENSIIEQQDELRTSMLKCLTDTKDDDQRQKCIDKARPKPKGRKAGEYDNLQPDDVWDEAMNVYRLNVAEVRLEAVEKLFGELPIDEPFKVQIETALRLHDATELDKRYIREGEKL